MHKLKNKNKFTDFVYAIYALQILNLFTLNNASY